MNTFHILRERILSNCKRGRYIVFPYGGYGEMVETILKAEGVDDLYIVDNFKADASRPEIMIDGKFADYIVLLCTRMETYHDECRKQLAEMGISNGRIIDMYPYEYSENINEKIIYDNVETIGKDDARMGMLERCAREISYHKVKGNCAEAGVYRRDFSRHINLWFPYRKLYLIDTFEGFEKKTLRRTDDSMPLPH